VAPCCARPGKAKELDYRSRKRELERRVNQLAAKELAAVKAATEAEQAAQTPEPAKKRTRAWRKTREQPWLSPAPESGGTSEQGTPNPAETTPEVALVAALVPNSLALASSRPRAGRKSGSGRPVPAGLPEKDRARELVKARAAARTGRIETPSAKARQALVAWTLEEGQRSAGHVSPKEYWNHVSDSTGFTAIQVRQWCKPDHQRRLELWLQGQEALRKQRACSRWLRFKSQDTGCRMTKEGGKKATRPDLFAVFYPMLRDWASRQRDAGWDVGGDDLMDEYKDVVESELWRLEELEEAGEELSSENQAWLKALRSRMDSLKIKDSAKKCKARVKCMTGFTEQKPGLVSPLTPPETSLILQLTWQSWDYTLHKVFTAGAQELEHQVIDPEGWVANRASVPLVFWDAVPAYLDPSAGTVLVDVDELSDLRLRREARKMLAKGLRSQKVPGCVSVRPSGDAMGATRRDKNRLTLVLRQVITEIYDLPLGQLPEGKHLPTLLIVQASQPCMLADMSRGPEPAVWLRDHSVKVSGRDLERKVGEPVGALMSTWRQVRRDLPELFDAGVLVLGFAPRPRPRPGPLRCS